MIDSETVGQELLGALDQLHVLFSRTRCMCTAAVRSAGSTPVAATRALRRKGGSCDSARAGAGDSAPGVAPAAVKAVRSYHSPNRAVRSAWGSSRTGGASDARILLQVGSSEAGAGRSWLDRVRYHRFSGCSSRTSLASSFLVRNFGSQHFDVIFQGEGGAEHQQAGQVQLATRDGVAEQWKALHGLARWPVARPHLRRKRSS